jgi:peptide/histidine transporter 3/4
LNFSNAEADIQYSAWSGFAYVTPLLGGYIADTYLGRYKTILVGDSLKAFYLCILQLFGLFTLHLFLFISSVLSFSLALRFYFIFTVLGFSISS